MKKCNRCGQIKPKEQFYKSTKRKDGKESLCKECCNLRTKKWRTENKRRYNETNREYRAAKRENRYVPQKEGARLRDFCKNGHDMSIYRKRNKAGNFCSLCRAIKAGEFRKNNSDRFKKYCRKSKVKRAYGITPEEITSMLQKQGGCAICGTNNFNGRGPSVDHNHTTGEIRGILCTNCNTGIGMFKDNLENMGRAIAYIKGVK